MPLTQDQMKLRVNRALEGTTPGAALGRVKAIVGPATERLVQQAMAKMEAATKLTPQEWAALETLVRTLRPAPLSLDGRLDDLESETSGAFPNWNSFRESIRPHLYCIGRVDAIDADPGLAGAVGTGFLISDSLLLTNCHVLDKLSRGLLDLVEGQAHVWFKQEWNQSTQEEERPVKVLGVVACDEGLDVAALRVEKQELSDTRRALELTPDSAGIGSRVAAIGYPSKDSDRNPAFLPILFGNRFGVKRCAPGEVTQVKNNIVFHDCSTLGGNSGSPLFSMETAKVVGVHFGGQFLYANKAARGTDVLKFAAPHMP